MDAEFTSMLSPSDFLDYSFDPTWVIFLIFAILVFVKKINSDTESLKRAAISSILMKYYFTACEQLEPTKEK